MLRLRPRAHVQAVYRHGRRFFAPWVVLHAKAGSRHEASSAGPRLAVTAVRGFRGAVQRNRARRLVRETCRFLLTQHAEPWDLLLSVRPQVLTTTFPERCHTITALLQQAGVLSHKAASAK